MLLLFNQYDVVRLLAKKKANYFDPKHVGAFSGPTK